MATFYVDWDNGLDTNNGTSWATAWKTVSSGATAARINQGDVIRCSKSPDAIATGVQATWVAGNASLREPSISGATNASPIVITTSSSHGLTTGDWVQVAGQTGNTAANGSWQIEVVGGTTFRLVGSTGSGTGNASGTTYKMMNVVALDQTVAATIDRCETAWTSANSTVCAVDSTQWREGAFSAKFTLPASGLVANRLYAYRTLPASLDLSGYQQVSLSFYSGTVLLAGRLKICLCTDTAGTVIAHTIPLPAYPATGMWMPITVDFAAPLDVAIQSVALYSDSTAPPNSTVINVDSIVACRAASDPAAVTLTSLVSRDGSSWHNVQSISGNVLRLGQTTSIQPSVTRGYYSDNAGTGELLRRETIKIGPMANGTSPMTLNDQGAVGFPITFEGGWNRTTGLRDGETWLDGLNSNGYGVGASSNGHYNNVSGFSFVRFAQGIYSPGAMIGSSFQFGHIVACSTGVSLGNGAAYTITGEAVNNCLAGISAVNVIGSTFSVNRVTSIGNASSSGTGINISTAHRNKFTIGLIADTASAVGNAGYQNKLFIQAIQDNSFNGVSYSGAIGSTVSGCTFARNNNTDLNNMSNSFDNVAENCTFATVVTFDYADCRLATVTPEGLVRHYSDGVLVSQLNNSSIATRPGGKYWDISFPSGGKRSAVYPYEAPLARIAVEANQAVTVTLKTRRPSTTAVSLGVICRGGQIAGVPNDVVGWGAGAVNTWADATISFTPTTSGVVEIGVIAHAGTGWACQYADLTVEQA